jgi:tetratricopeptide (TPR) repeat protein
MKIKDKTMEIIDRAEQLLKDGKHPEAIALYEAVHKTHPEEESVLLMLAWAHYDNGDTSKALQYLETILERELKRKIFTGFAFDELVRIYKQERKFDNLVEICRKAVNAQPNDVSLLAELGGAYLNAEKHQEACQIFEKLIGMENDNPVFIAGGEKRYLPPVEPRRVKQRICKRGKLIRKRLTVIIFNLLIYFKITAIITRP